MVTGLGIWHILLIMAVLAVIALVIAVIIIVIVRTSSKNQTAVHGNGASERLAQLEQARAAGLVTDAEYQSKRAQILGQL